MPSCVMWNSVALVRTDVSKEYSTSLARVERICEPGKTVAVTSKSNTNALEQYSSPTVILDMSPTNIPFYIVSGYLQCTSVASCY
jgi:hypothetical protein